MQPKCEGLVLALMLGVRCGPFFPFVALHCWACLLFWGFAPLSLFVCLCVHRCLSSFCLPFNPFICLSAWLHCLWLCLDLSFVTFYLAGLLSVFASFGLCLLSPFASSLSPVIWLHLVGWARGFCSIISAADNGFAGQYLLLLQGWGGQVGCHLVGGHLWTRINTFVPRTLCCACGNK